MELNPSPADLKYKKGQALVRPMGQETEWDACTNAGEWLQLCKDKAQLYRDTCLEKLGESLANKAPKGAPSSRSKGTAKARRRGDMARSRRQKRQAAVAARGAEASRSSLKEFIQQVRSVEPWCGHTKSRCWLMRCESS